MKNDYYIAFVCDTDTIIAAADTVSELKIELNKLLDDRYLEESDFHDIIVAKTELEIGLERRTDRWHNGGN